MEHEQVPKRIDFVDLSKDDYDFLKTRVQVKKCPNSSHQSQAHIKKTDGKVIIENICCEKFAILIGNSLSIRNINEFAIQTRGEFLNTFSTLEVYVDATIELCSLLFASDFSNGVPVELNMREKKQLFQICLKRYSITTNTNIDRMWGHFCNVIEKRNHLAHWSVDTSSEALTLLKTKKVRFVNMKHLKIVSEDIFDGKSTSKLVMKIEKLTIETMGIYKYFRNYRSL